MANVLASAMKQNPHMSVRDSKQRCHLSVGMFVEEAQHDDALLEQCHPLYAPIDPRELLCACDELLAALGIVLIDEPKNIFDIATTPNLAPTIHEVVTNEHCQHLDGVVGAARNGACLGDPEECHERVLNCIEGILGIEPAAPRVGEESTAVRVYEMAHPGQKAWRNVRAYLVVPLDRFVFHRHHDNDRSGEAPALRGARTFWSRT